MPSAATKKRPSVVKEEEGMTPKKTALIIVTVIGCIAILWPKVFHPMMFGSAPPPPPQQQNLKDQRSGAPGGCCDVVLDREQFMNTTKPDAAVPFGPHLYRKHINLYTGEISLRQERPAHLHPESIYQAMRERGRAIPATPTVPIVERKSSASNPPPRIVDGRPGPIPGMRPPMGAGALQQPQQRGSSMGFLMPLYTIGIVVFFGYTIMKIAFKKQVPNAPYGPAPSDTGFRQQVFGQQQEHSQVEDLGGTKLGIAAVKAKAHEAPTNGRQRSRSRSRSHDEELYNASVSATEVASNLSISLKHHQEQMEKEQLMEIEKLRQKLEDTERAMAKLIAEMNSDQYEAKQNDNEKTKDQLEKDKEKDKISSNGHANVNTTDQGADPAAKGVKQQQQRKRRDLSAERELTSKLEGNLPEPQSIYLEGALAHDSQILVADAQTKREEVYDTELNGSAEEPAVILSSKMTLSLINLDANQQNGNWGKPEIESPLADDIEIIGHDEQ
ncbi:resistance to inhibitors of cholinesterase protein 3 isoform X4 [Drosophila pseudoobscura]|uniref:Resistance to inhibitors of cholinesterase protein 3 isoform X4 n=1 Tax=Drosophila pseudoobscura pseudoobscura TaxID=46245 RepID=A0A6I8VSY5_DROPS|nr:resistance to inhibitors of cholinesterase protein 3 isoform X4 [Drosophila pseudoobscura]